MSEERIEGKFKLSEEELDNVAGGDGCGSDEGNNDECYILVDGTYYFIVQPGWKCICDIGDMCLQCGHMSKSGNTYFCSICYK